MSEVVWGHLALSVEIHMMGLGGEWAIWTWSRKLIPSFFPGFPPPPRGQNGQQDGPHGPEQPLAGADLVGGYRLAGLVDRRAAADTRQLRALMSIMAEDGGLGGFGPGPQGRMDTGDYVMTQREFCYNVCEARR